MLDSESCKAILEVCKETEAQMLRYDSREIGNRNPGRYSFGSRNLDIFYNEHAAVSIMIYAYANRTEDDDATFTDFFL